MPTRCMPSWIGLLLKDVVIVGNSLGCLMAGAYAAAHPERVRSMILLSPAAGHAGDEASSASWLEQFEARPRRPGGKRSPTLVGKASPREAVEPDALDAAADPPAGLSSGGALPDARPARLRTRANSEEGAGRLRQRGHRHAGSELQGGRGGVSHAQVPLASPASGTCLTSRRRRPSMRSIQKP